MSAQSIMASGHTGRTRPMLQQRQKVPARAPSDAWVRPKSATITSCGFDQLTNLESTISCFKTELPAGRRCAPLKKCHRADFDAFARPRMRRGGGILERGVRGPARAAVLHRIKHLEYIGLLAPHAREPVPLVFWIILDRIGLADASGRAPL